MQTRRSNISLRLLVGAVPVDRADDRPRVGEVEPRVEVEVPHQVGLVLVVLLVAVARPDAERHRGRDAGVAALDARAAVDVAEILESISHSCGSRSAMRNISARALESTPGQLYCRRFEPAMTSTRNGRWSGGSLPFSSFGLHETLLLFRCFFATRVEDDGHHDRRDESGAEERPLPRASVALLAETFPGGAEIDVEERPGQHPHGGRRDVGNEVDRGQAEEVVRERERDERGERGAARPPSSRSSRSPHRSRRTSDCAAQASRPGRGRHNGR